MNGLMACDLFWHEDPLPVPEDTPILAVKYTHHRGRVEEPETVTEREIAALEKWGFPVTTLTKARRR
jgi:hypothetical protein